MFRGLRNRLILSHILPVLLIIPLMGAAMVYVLETRLLLPVVYKDLAADAALMAEITRNQPIFWQNREAAYALVNGVTPYVSGRVSLVALDGHILASGDEIDNISGSQVVELPNLAGIKQGETIQLQNGTLAEVFTPVFDLQGQPIGIIRMTTHVVTVSDEVYQLRYLLGTILLIGVLSGVGLGSYLAFNINRPIQQVTGSIQALAQGDWQAHVEEQGPEEMRRLAATANTLVDQLNSLEHARRQLLANLVHELGRPLGAIRSAIQALLHGANKDAQFSHELLTGMNDETLRLQHLLEELAGLQDQVLGRLELNPLPVQLHDWLVSTLSPWEAAAREKGLDWKLEIAPQLPIVRMDPDRMAQAIGNILSNAIKFTPTGGQVATVVTCHPNIFSIEVTDTGPGIPSEEQKKIFQPFYRVHQGHRIVEGMGLGLSIAREVARAHGGEIQVESTPKRGSKFRLQIPV